MHVSPFWLRLAVNVRVDLLLYVHACTLSDILK
jgi:hypothetical protein